ncbi:hypothetical protein VHEMI09665 [[Torrubiella] hemipterigena]|uniref:ATP-grasp domain-containing protein n=1 Tax=[Torrubiella] hemipterigena TaxID=1531966 RepID=A0A0A1TGW5_9HYPO|nr:hypothetical protein VHEMI09665 [[Torrubiella] hemipterigena]
MGSTTDMNELVALYALPNDNNVHTYSFSWRENLFPKSFVIQTVDLVITKLDSNNNNQASKFEWPESIRSGLPVGYDVFDIRTFLENALATANSNTAPAAEVAIKLILPATAGYVAQSNIIQTRLHACPGVISVAGFLQPGEYIEPQTPSVSRVTQLNDLLSAAIGAAHCIINDSESSQTGLDNLDTELRNRLDIRFLQAEPVPRTRLGIVQCLNYQMSLELLQHLNIHLVVFDEPGTLFEDPNGPLAYLRDSFHLIDLNPDETFTERLYAAAHDLRLDGLTTRFDAILDKVAHVAQLLKLPTSPPSALKIATDKYLTRITQPDYDKAQSPAIQVRNRTELEERLRDPVNPLNIPYPVVVKPTNGWGSYGVAKAINKEELLAAVEWAAGYIIGFVNSRVMIEPYCDGPEVDINLALWDGEVTFFEVCDNAPTPGDLNQVSSTGRKDFQETMFMYPSQLPQSEQIMVRDYIHQCILGMGFTYGVFHCEARIWNSAMHYTTDPNTGIVDLETNSKADTIGGKPSVFLLEINARAPGYVGLYASSWNYGVDMWALHSLSCIGDEARFRLLSKTYTNGPQHDSALLLIMPDKRGILKSGDPMPRLKQENPELAVCVPLCLNYFKVGQEVVPPDDTENCFTSVLLVESKHGRRGLMTTVEEVRKEWTPIIE